MDNGWNSKFQIKILIKFRKLNLITKLNIKLEEFKDLQSVFLYAGVPDIELLTDHAIFSYILNYKLKIILSLSFLVN